MSYRHDRLLDPKVNRDFRILWNYKYRFAYCPIPKTGTTTWINILLDLVPWLDPDKQSRNKVILLPKPLTLQRLTKRLVRGCETFVLALA